jgi:diguanylate cyclase (GGDEF)-like protein
LEKLPINTFRFAGSEKPKMNQKILVIEDNPISRKVVRVALEAEGYRVIEAADGRTGLTLMAQETPDLVLQDLLLPDFNGFDLVWELRAVRRDEKIPILALTGLIAKADAMRVTDSPFTDYLFKPVEPAHLVSVVRSHLASAQPQQEKQGRNRRVLVVDDEPAQLKLLATYLSHLGFQVTTASDGNDGLIKAQTNRPDAIVSDVLMAGLDGFQLCMKLRENAELAQVPVVLRSNLYEHEGDKELARQVGAYALVPTTPDFHEAIEALFESLEASPLPPANDPAALQAVHEERLAHQLNRQAKLGAELAQRCAAQSAQLSVLASVGENFFKGKVRNEALLNDILARCLDVIGFSRGAIFLADSKNRLDLSAQIGFSAEAAKSLPTFFGYEDLLCNAMLQTEPVTLSFPAGRQEPFEQSLADMRDDSVIICPLWSGAERLGVVSLMSNMTAPDTDKITFAKAITNEISQVIALNRSITRLQYLASYDSLTDLPNRAHLSERLQLASANGGPSALYLLNLDHFQEINNTLGYRNGNLLLRQVANRLSETFRDRAVTARLGADEFALLFGEAPDETVVHETAKEILKSLEPTFRLDGLPIAVRATMGIVILRGHGEEAETLLSYADMSQRAAKRTGNDYLIYPTHVESYGPDFLTLMGELREAIEQNRLVLHYQPKVNFKTGQTIGVEALLRWPHPRRGWVPPDQFISLAERAGLIHPITLWVLTTALKQAQAWRDGGLEIGVAVNVAVRDLQDPTFPDFVLQACRSTSMPPRALTLELTERSLMTDPVKTTTAFQRLSDDGVRLSIDDFGTGYSSFSYLQKLPVNEIKIDKSFVGGLLSDQRSEAIVRSVIDLGRNLGLAVVAEGVENQRIWECLASLGCDVAQGYHICRPSPAAELVAALKNSAWVTTRNESTNVQEL